MPVAELLQFQQVKYVGQLGDDQRWDYDVPNNLRGRRTSRGAPVEGGHRGVSQGSSAGSRRS